MKVKRIDLPEVSKRRMTTESMCTHRVRGIGSRLTQPGTYSCRRYATFIMNGKNLCTQHSGEVALAHLLKND